MGDLRAGYRFLAPALRAVGYRVACTFVRERSRAPGPPPSAPWLAIDEAGDLATPSLVMAAGELIINARRPGHGTVRPRRIRAITGELRAMARMQAWL